ncbi:arginine--tRNA ligase, partial [Candidatus Curtissbacteria bacterium]|nr:arginine--tRNA ligase [Candidatus Curtissbacteria bacterium]
MLREQIRKDVLEAVRQLGYWDVGKIAPKNLTTQKPNNLIEVTRTQDPKFGDYATNVALKIRSSVFSSRLSDTGQSAKRLTGKQKTGKLQSENRKPKTGNKQSATEIANILADSLKGLPNILADSLKGLPYIKKLEVAGPGFLNFWIKDEVWQQQVEEVLKTNEKFGSSESGKGKNARIEFVSANPTGPLHFGNARGGPIGDALASVLEFCGYKVVREYYHNDIGEQVRKLGESIVNVTAGLKLEDQEYKGEYVRELGVKAVNELSKGLKFSSSDASRLGELAVETLLSEILADCKAMGISFNQIYKESEFINSGQTKQGLDHLREKGFLKEKDGAIWFAANDEFLKDRETVVKKSDGNFTYFANDIAYHDLKFKDNPDLVIDIFGANHHGHVPRLQAVISALGYDVSKFRVILYQWVRFKKKGEMLAMSKRSGTFVTAREVLDEVGSDALRFFILMYDPNSHIDFDMDLAREKSTKNPVYYVQYAHARICSILAKTNDKRLTTNAKYDELTTTYELDLIKQISRLPEM